jgi:hypothetical protein
VQDPRVAARSRLESRAQIAEQFDDDLGVAQSCQRQAPMRFAVDLIFASVINGSTTRRNSFALGSVVRMVSCRSSDAAILRSIAWRCGALRDSWRPESL